MNGDGRNLAISCELGCCFGFKGMGRQRGCLYGLGFERIDPMVET